MFDVDFGIAEEKCVNLNGGCDDEIVADHCVEDFAAGSVMGLVHEVAE